MKIDGYKLTKFIKKGAYGQVYEAFKESSNEKVAIKVLLMII